MYQAQLALRTLGLYRVWEGSRITASKVHPWRVDKKHRQHGHRCNTMHLKQPASVQHHAKTTACNASAELHSAPPAHTAADMHTAVRL